MGGYAWVTLATNDSYSLGALVLARSLEQVGTKHPIAVLVTPGVTNAMRSKLTEVFNVVQEVNLLDSRDEENLRLLKRPELGVTFTKLHCWRLTQFDKCVFLDADTLVLENCDELFEREELSAAPDIGWPDCFNSGVFVFRPSNETYEKLIQFAIEKGSFDGGDQGLLNLYFSDWAHKDISKHLPFIYNMASTACYSYLPAFKQFGKTAKIIHFIGASKPWLQYFDTETRKVHPAEGLKHLQEILQCWWNLFCTIHSSLSPEMAGLAGAFAKLTLGAPRTPEQAALDDHLRRQGWEVGNIDYLGKDSFDNIWSKICETLSAAPEQPIAKTESPKVEAKSKVALPSGESPKVEAKSKVVPLTEVKSDEKADLDTEDKEKPTAEGPVVVESQIPSEAIIQPPPTESSEQVVISKDAEIQKKTPVTESLPVTSAAPSTVISETITPVSRTPEAVTSAAVTPVPASLPSVIPEPEPQTPAQVVPTSAPETPLAVTTASVTPSPVTPAPETPTPATPAAVTSATVASTPVIPAAETPAPIIPEAKTPAPSAPSPVTITSVPVTPAAVTSAPATPEPVDVTPAPVTPVPVAPVSVAPVPVAPVPVAPTPAAPVTPVPVTAVPVAPVSVAPVPVTPVPVTSAPVTPPPVILSPTTVTGADETPTPVARAVISPVPSTPAPIVPPAVTPAPSTPAPVTPPAVSPAPVTPSAVIPAPATPAPATPAPETAAKVTPSPVTPPPVAPASVTPVTTTVSDTSVSQSLESALPSKDDAVVQPANLEKTPVVALPPSKAVDVPVSESSAGKAIPSLKEVSGPTVCPVAPKSKVQEKSSGSSTPTEAVLLKDPPKTGKSSKDPHKKPKEGIPTPKTRVTEPTPPSTPASPQIKETKPALGVETVVPETPPVAAPESSSAPTPTPRKVTRSDKKTGTKTKK